MRVRLTALVGFVVAVSVSGCGDDYGPTTSIRGSGRAIRRRIPTSKRRAATRKPTETADLGPFVYKPGRDPFQSYFDITGGPQRVTKLEPLQKHDLSKLKVIAIITGTVQPAAMVLDPGGKPHLVKRGTLVGPPRGRIARILSDRIVVEREYKDRLERIHRLVHVLKIRKDEKDGER